MHTFSHKTLTEVECTTHKEYMYVGERPLHNFAQEIKMLQKESCHDDPTAELFSSVCVCLCVCLSVCVLGILGIAN